MAGYEQCIIIGNVGRDPELRYTQNGNVPVCSFTVAVTTKSGSGDNRTEKTNWYKVTAWRQLAEVCNQYVRKGMQIMVVGTPSVSAYMGNDNQPRASLELTARDIQFLGGNRSDQSIADGEDYTLPSSESDIPF